MIFVLYSTTERITADHLAAIARASTPALADVAAAWSPVYPDVAAPSVRLASNATDFAAGEVPVLFVADLGAGNEMDLALHYIRNGLPYALVLADYYQPLTSVQQAAWHEMAETLVDPMCGRYLDGWAVEVCDPVQSDPVVRNGVTLSPFVLPAWFSDERGTVDSSGFLLRGHTVRPGGYSMREDGSEVHGAGYRHAPQKSHPTSRRMRRRAKMRCRCRKPSVHESGWCGVSPCMGETIACTGCVRIDGKVHGREHHKGAS